MNTLTQTILTVILLVNAFEVSAFESLIKSRVTATAYNSVARQTDDTPNLAAWNNPIKPGDRIIAVSRDLLRQGLTNGVKVKIVGFDGLFTVRDKMNKRWRHRIDIYMGDTEDKAFDWGKRRVSIIWNPTWQYRRQVAKENKKHRRKIRLAMANLKKIKDTNNKQTTEISPLD